MAVSRRAHQPFWRLLRPTYLLSRSVPLWVALTIIYWMLIWQLPEVKDETGLFESRSSCQNSAGEEGNSTASSEDDSLKYIIFHNRDTTYVPFANTRSVLNSHGWKEVRDPTENFTLLWAWGDPLQLENWKAAITDLRSDQHVSFIPGLDKLTHKGTLSDLDLSFMPRSFVLPRDLEKLRDYASRNPETAFIFKNRLHRGIRYVEARQLQSEIWQMDFGNTFLQEFISNPLLIDGYKFDIGVYVVITSVKPLRIYVLNDVSELICGEKFHPFNGSNTNKFVVHHPIKHLWDIPGWIQQMYPEHSRKDIISAYIRSLHHDPKKVWDRIDGIIATVILKQQKSALAHLEQFSNSQNFFCLLRVDIILNDKLNVFLTEVNQGPGVENESGEIQVGYKRVLDAVFKLKGLIDADYLNEQISVHPEWCFSKECRSRKSCNETRCYLCKRCLSQSERAFLLEARREHLNSRELLHRVYPIPYPNQVSRDDDDDDIEDDDDDIEDNYFSGLSREDRLLHEWFRAMCKKSAFWCQ